MLRIFFCGKFIFHVELERKKLIKCSATLVVRLCVCGNQQVEGVHYKSGDLYAPVMKASEDRLMVAIAAHHGYKLLKTDTKQAFLNGEIGDEKIYIRARTSSSRTCPVADEEHVRNSAGSPSMASENFWMDGIA